MVRDAQLSKEVVVTVVNKIGVLADMSKIISSHGINILGVAGYAAEDNNAKIMMVTDDNLRTGDALKKAGYKSLKESEIVIVDLEDKPGALRIVTEKLAAAGIDIRYIYGTTCGGGCPAKIVLSTSDNEKAILAFKK